jgi:hypothetical protein
MRPMLKATIALMVVLAGFYAVISMLKGVAMVRSGGAVPVLLGLAVLVVPLLGLALVARELWFGRQCARLAEDLGSEDGLGAELESLPRRPSGRVDRGAADEHFAKVREETEADPDRWQAWYRLSLAYDAAGDRSRARAAARHAIELHRRAAL